MRRSTRCHFAAVVAELEAAEEASHVVAAFCALNLCPAHGAKDNAIDTLADSCELRVHGIFAAGPIAVPVFSAAEADRVRTLRTAELLCVHAGRLHESVAVWLGAKTHHRIALEQSPVSEFFELGKDLGLVVPKNPLELLQRNFAAAAVFEALDVVQLVAFDLLPQLFAAVETEAMLAVELDCDAVCDGLSADLDFVVEADLTVVKRSGVFRLDARNLTGRHNQLRREALHFFLHREVTALSARHQV